jgi:hypothetical protein
MPKDIDKAYVYNEEVEETLMSGIATTNSQ